MRAVLQAISLPSQSVKKNIESVQKQYKSKSILPSSIRTKDVVAFLPNYLQTDLVVFDLLCLTLNQLQNPFRMLLIYNFSL